MKTFTTIEELQLTATSKETGKLLDSKTENTLRRWFELRTSRHLEALSLSSPVQRFVYVPFSVEIGT